MRLDHLLSTENVLSAWHGSRGFLPGVSGVLAWKDRCVPVVGAGMGMLLGSLAATALLVGGWRSGARHGFLSGCRRVGVCGVAWWFENWRVDASGPRGRPFLGWLVVVCLY